MLTVYYIIRLNSGILSGKTNIINNYPNITTFISKYDMKKESVYINHQLYLSISKHNNILVTVNIKIYL